MRVSIVVLGLGLALTAGCSSSSDSPEADKQTSSSSSESSSPDKSDGGEGGKGAPLNFRPVLHIGPADAGAPADAPKEMRQPYASSDCTEKPAQTKPSKPVVSCGTDNRKYLLGPAIVSNGLTHATAVEFEGSWVVAVIVDKAAQKDFAKFADDAENSTVLAYEHEGVVLDARGVEQLADKGRTGVDGDFSKEEAEELADTLSQTIG